VQDLGPQHGGVLDERAGDEHALALAAGEGAEHSASSKTKPSRTSHPATTPPTPG